MNVNDLLAQILEIANYPKDKREAFVRDFYNYYFTKLIDSVGGADPTLARKMVFALDHFEENPAGLSEIWNQVNSEQKLKDIADRVFGEAINELIDDIVKYATDIEKQQILAVVNSQPS